MKMHPQYIVNEQGDRTGVVLTIDEFQCLIEGLEDSLDAKDLDEAVGSESQCVEYEEVREQLRAKGRL